MSATTTDRTNSIDTEALRRTMDAVKRDHSTGVAGFAVTTDWKGQTRSETRVEGWELGGQPIAKNFTIAIDEPAELLGQDSAPNPQEYLLAAMNACMLNTFVVACAVQGITLESLQIESRGELDLRGFLGLNASVKPGYDQIEYTVRVKGDGTPQQYEKVHQWMRKTSPNYFNMANAIRLNANLVVE